MCVCVIFICSNICNGFTRVYKLFDVVSCFLLFVSHITNTSMTMGDIRHTYRHTHGQWHGMNVCRFILLPSLLLLLYKIGRRYTCTHTHTRCTVVTMHIRVQKASRHHHRLIRTVFLNALRPALSLVLPCCMPFFDVYSLLVMLRMRVETSSQKTQHQSAQTHAHAYVHTTPASA